MNDKKDLIERKERTILDNPPSKETAFKMAEFFMRTSIPRILEEERKAREEEAKATMKNDE
ncbi:hypothetical protein [Bacillus wiedmannii]|uniref:hypothetical protein n=1 Tax=Bacillus wiedmannii TaxID=1890302 RepID=UPI000BEF2CAB|nr:hypothetical protein [Bacillus wiedmannii]PEM33756.1 hypothetical protein CN598_04440 [Bacillus wiedmannii]